MKHEDYVDACERTELKDRPAQVRNRKTGEVGEVVQCVSPDKPEGFLVRVEQELTTWPPEDVEEIEEA